MGGNVRLDPYLKKGTDGLYHFDSNAVVKDGSLFFCRQSSFGPLDNCCTHLTNNSGYDRIREYVRLTDNQAREYMAKREDDPHLPSYIKSYGQSIITVRKPSFSDTFLNCGQTRSLIGTGSFPDKNIEDVIMGLVRDSFGVSKAEYVSPITWFIIPDLLYGMHLQPEVYTESKAEQLDDWSVLVIPRTNKEDRTRVPYAPSDGVDLPPKRYFPIPQPLVPEHQPLNS
jgi:hypothetical protein